MSQFQVTPIGTVNIRENGIFLELEPEYIPGLKALEGFSHLNVFWWFSHYDTAEMRSILETPKPYKKAPEVMGVFATRSPLRPNPIAMTAVEIIGIDYTNGRIQIAYIDADDKTPILDLKPYTPSLDRIESPDTPGWCSHWPKSVEQSGSFDWENEFNFQERV